MTGYELSRNWFDFCFENPDKIKPNHTALYFFAIEHCNRLGWKEKFGFPSQMAMEAIGIKNWRTYSATLKDLVSFGFINMVEVSKNQYSANVIAIVKNTKAQSKALDKALQKHSQKQSSSTACIDKPINKEQNNNITLDARKLAFKESLFPFVGKYKKETVKAFFEYWSEHGPTDKKMRFEKEKSFGVTRRLSTWEKNESKFNKSPNHQKETATHVTLKKHSEKEKQELREFQENVNKQKITNEGKKEPNANSSGSEWPNVSVNKLLS